ncbi:MAG: flagellin [Clostridium sp.]|nr:flagellin [Clostridium sp.]
MIINHNMAQINAIKNNGINNVQCAKAMEKLTTGLRINRAADDSAGLSISEKMKAQIRGLSQAQRNAQDGTSLIQVADGALSDVQDILNRVRSLTVQAANDTNVNIDREAIQSEVNENLNEIQRISNETEFNSIPLLNGTFNLSKETDKNGIANKVNYITQSGGITDSVKINNKDYACAKIDFSNLKSEADVQKLVGYGVNYTCCTCTKAYSIKFVNGNSDATRLNDANPVMEVDVSKLTTGNEVVDKIIQTAKGTGITDHYSKLSSYGDVLYIYDDRTENYGRKWPDQAGEGKFELNVFGEQNPDIINQPSLNFQVGANTAQRIQMELPNSTLKSMKLDNPILSILSYLDASISLNRIDNAIEYINTKRSEMGAYENRLEHALFNACNSTENMQSSQSKIADADIAKEVLNKIRYNTLNNASQSMIIQSDAFPKGILEILKNKND